MSSFEFPSNIILPETLIIDASNLSSTKKIWNFPSAWTQDFGYRKVIVKNSNIHPFSLNGVVQNYYPTGRTTPIIVIFEDGMTVANITAALQYIGYNTSPPWPKIYGEIDLSLLDGTVPYFWNPNVEHIEFKPNTCFLTTQFAFNYNKAVDFLATCDNETIISIGNVLNDNTNGNLSFPDSAITRISSIMGNNNTTNGYNLFIPDENGTISLKDFITNIKGWNLQ